MEAYNKVNELISAIKDSSEYKDLRTAKAAVDGDAESKKMMDDFRQKQMELQQIQASGQEIPKEKIEQIQGLYSVLLLNSKINDYLNAELQFNKLMNDLFKILGDEIAKDLGME